MRTTPPPLPADATTPALSTRGSAPFRIQFQLTCDEYAAANRLLQSPTKSVRVSVMQRLLFVWWTIGAFVLALLLTAIDKRVTVPRWLMTAAMASLIQSAFYAVLWVILSFALPPKLFLGLRRFMAVSLIAVCVIQTITSASGSDPQPSSGNSGIWVMALVMLMVGALVVYHARRTVRVASRQTWDGQPHLHSSQIVEVGETGVSVRYTHARYEAEWAGLVRFRESDSLFLICPSEVSMIAIPKRAIADPRLIDSLREMLTSRIPNEDVRRQGFAVVVPTGEPPASA